jgi:hypothetical protein
MSEYQPPIIRLSSFADAQSVSIPIADGLRACNPSIAVDGGGLQAIVRTVNYELNNVGGIISMPGGFPVSANWLVDLNRELRITSVREIDDSAFCGPKGLFPGGFEDCRLFNWKGAWWFSASVVASVTPLIVKMVLCRLEAEYVAECNFVSSPNQTAMEKNWMPCIEGDSLRWIYRIDPMQIVEYRNDGPSTHDLIGQTGRLETWSGSSQCVRYRNGWLCVIHRRVRWPEGSIYEHCFVELTDNFHICRVSDAWIFEKPSVEFCAGLCVLDKYLCLSYGVLDRRAHVLRLKLSHVERMLRADILSRTLTRGSQAFGRWVRSYNLR